MRLSHKGNRGAISYYRQVYHLDAAALETQYSKWKFMSRMGEVSIYLSFLHAVNGLLRCQKMTIYILCTGFCLGSKNLLLSHNTRWHAEVFGQPSLHLAKVFVVAAGRIRELATMLRFLAVFVAMSPLIALKLANFAPFGKVQKVVCTCLRLCFLG